MTTYKIALLLIVTCCLHVTVYSDYFTGLTLDPILINNANTAIDDLR